MKNTTCPKLKDGGTCTCGYHLKAPNTSLKISWTSRGIIVITKGSNAFTKSQEANPMPMDFIRLQILLVLKEL
jgi:hypothetical protein